VEGYFRQRTKVNEQDVVENIRGSSHVLKHQTDLSPLFDRIGDARIVLLGEASHGTQEFYTWRSFITEKLITEKGKNLQSEKSLRIVGGNACHLFNANFFDIS